MQSPRVRAVADLAAGIDPFAALQDRPHERERSVRKRSSVEGVGCVNNGPLLESQTDHSLDQASSLEA